MQVYQQLIEKKAALAVIGLGYVGLPVALSFAKKIRVLGLDTDAARVALLQQGIDPAGEMSSRDFAGTDIIFTSNPADIRDAVFYLVAVPTPVDKHKVPDLTALKAAAVTVGQSISRNNCVVFESTVYPGCTEEECLPLIEKISGLQCGDDFKLGYSPERINPGDKVHTLANTVKIVAGSDEGALAAIASVYELVVAAGVYRAPNIKTAEAAKIVENTQRDAGSQLDDNPPQRRSLGLGGSQVSLWQSSTLRSSYGVNTMKEAIGLTQEQKDTAINSTVAGVDDMDDEHNHNIKQVIKSEDEGYYSLEQQQENEFMELEQQEDFKNLWVYIRQNLSEAENEVLQQSLFTKKETPAPVTGDTVTIKGGYQKPGNK
ncbi:nucleotide sugar dehydrogenase [Ostertagia ostertagi]